MVRDAISGKQLMILLFLSLLSPGVQLAPGWAAERAGAVGWLAGLGAIPLLLLAGWLVWRAVTRQGFSFEAGLRPGAEIPAVFSSPAYTLAAAALAVLTLWQSFRPN